MRDWKITIWLTTDDEATQSDIASAIEGAELIRDGQYQIERVLIG